MNVNSPPSLLMSGVSRYLSGYMGFHGTCPSTGVPRYLSGYRGSTVPVRLQGFHSTCPATGVPLYLSGYRVSTLPVRLLGEGQGGRHLDVPSRTDN